MACSPLSSVFICGSYASHAVGDKWAGRGGPALPGSGGAVRGSSSHSTFKITLAGLAFVERVLPFQTGESREVSIRGVQDQPSFHGEGGEMAVGGQVSGTSQ